jgi:tetratricopeptide (TPR) repeat protein
VANFNKFEEAALKIKMGSIYIGLGDIENAEAALQAGLSVVPQDANWLRGGALLDLGTVCGAQGDYQQAELNTLQAQKIYGDLNDQFHLVDISINLGMIKDFTGNWAGAASHYEHALKIAERLGSVTHQVRLNLNLGILNMNQGLDDDAKDCFTKSISLSRSMDLLELEINALIGQAQLHIRRNEVKNALPYLLEAEEKASSKRALDQLAEIYRNQAEASLTEGNLTEAHDHIQKAISISKEVDYKLEEGICQRILGQVDIASGNLQIALESFKVSLSILEETEPYEGARTKLALGMALINTSEKIKGVSLLNESKIIFAEFGAKRELAFVEQILSQLE